MATSRIARTSIDKPRRSVERGRGPDVSGGLHGCPVQASRADMLGAKHDVQCHCRACPDNPAPPLPSTRSLDASDTPGHDTEWLNRNRRIAIFRRHYA